MNRQAMTPESLALCAFLAQPSRHGGLLIRSARPGLVRQALETVLKRVIKSSDDARGAAAGGRLARLSASTPSEALRPSLDVVQTLAAREPIHDPGWIDRHQDCLVLVSMAERMEPGLAHELAQALERRRLHLVLLEESIGDEPGVLPIVLDRMSMVLVQDRLCPAEQSPDDWAQQVEEVTLAWPRSTPARLDLSPDQWRRLAAMAAALDIPSLRPLMAAGRLAIDLTRQASPRARTVSDEAIEQALVATLLPHARRWPEKAPEQVADDQQSAADSTSGEAEQPEHLSRDASKQDQPSAQPSSDQQDQQDQQAVEAALVDLQRGLLGGTGMDRGRLSRPGLARREGGRAGKRSWHPSRGRRLRVMAWKRGQPARQLAWVKVLERALPLQEMRHRVSPSEDRLLLMPSDLRIWRRQHRRPLTTIFLVDASGSMAATRLAEAKGAVQALLAECYVRRDQVALLSFGGQGVRVNLPPTRSLVAAKRALTALPGGGASPVAAGLQAVIRWVDRLAQQGEDAAVVVLSDGRANVCLDGEVNRALAGQQAEQAARALGLQTLRSIWIDASPRPEQAAQVLAHAMSAAYYPLPFASAGQIHGLVSSAMKSTTGRESVS
ncbi:MAG: VWA domain-containing protein [Betaproteobacteria bacterium]|nr:VWA domain-containing protein [Betaproteobacteria bacterium]